MLAWLKKLNDESIDEFGISTFEWIIWWTLILDLTWYFGDKIAGIL